MIPILVVLALTAAALVVLALGSRWAAERAIRSGVSARFADADHLVRTGRAPEGWMQDAQRPRFFGWRWRNPVQSEVKDRLLEKIDRLVAFFTSSQFVADDETREHLTSELDRVRQEWERSDLSGIAASSAD